MPELVPSEGSNEDSESEQAIHEQRLLRLVHRREELVAGDDVELIYTRGYEDESHWLRVSGRILMLDKRMATPWQPEANALAETALSTTRITDDPRYMLLVVVGFDVHDQPVPRIIERMYADFGLDPNAPYATNRIYKAIEGEQP